MEFLCLENIINKQNELTRAGYKRELQVIFIADRTPFIPLFKP
jgi:hypothetical protein